LIDKRWRTFLLQICLPVGLTLCVYLAARRGMGAWYFREGSPEAIQTAMKWDPANPQYCNALATLMHLYANGGNSSKIVHLYVNATHLSPYDAHFWADLGAGYDWAGRTEDALGALQHARKLFPNSPEINWRLANFYIRDGKILEGLRSLRIVLGANDIARRNVFVLATTATRDNKAILDEMIPPRASVLFDYLNYRIAMGNVVAAEEVWARVLQLKLEFDLRDAFPYLDALIQRRELGQLTEAWSALVKRFPSQIEPRISRSNLVTNGGFEHEILNGGMDWRVIPIEGAIVSLDSSDAFEGVRALQIKFDGIHNLDYAHIFQYVRVHPNTRYRFSGHMRVQGITTDSGPSFQIFDAYDWNNLFVSTENLLGTSAWSEQKAEFKTKAGTRMLLIRVARPLSSKFDNHISGTVWIDDVSLNEAGL
jgi:tetratricopeptide (TPR) repeat protein